MNYKYNFTCSSTPYFRRIIFAPLSFMSPRRPHVGKLISNFFCLSSCLLIH